MVIVISLKNLVLLLMNELAVRLAFLFLNTPIQHRSTRNVNHLPTLSQWHTQDIETPTSNDTYGYEPSRKDNLITAHIITQDGYGLFIDNHSLTLKYKYITLNYSRYSIGKYNYPINIIDSYKGSEHKHIKD